MEEIINSREFISYFTDILFGDRSYIVFTDVPKTDERYYKLGISGLITDFFNSKKTKGRVTDSIAKAIKQRCRFYLFPDEYNGYLNSKENIKFIESNKFANKFICLFSCLLNCNLNLIMIKDDDLEDLKEYKKTLIYSMIECIIDFFYKKSEADISKLKTNFPEMFSPLRSTFQKNNYSQFTKAELNAFDYLTYMYIMEYEENKVLFSSDPETEKTHYIQKKNNFCIIVENYINDMSDEKRPLSSKDENQLLMELSEINMYANYSGEFVECKFLVEKYIDKIDKNALNLSTEKLYNALEEVYKYLSFRMLVISKFSINEDN